MAFRECRLKVTRYVCDICGHQWSNYKSDLYGAAKRQPFPERCPSCRSRQWNGPKQRLIKPAKIVLPSPRKRGRPRRQPLDLDTDGE
jgi:hypothetical protein